MGHHQLHQWGFHGAGGLPGPVQHPGATAGAPVRQGQQDSAGHSGRHLQHLPGQFASFSLQH